METTAPSTVHSRHIEVVIHTTCPDVAITTDGDKPVRFLASSAVLKNASKVWSAMLSERFQECRATSHDGLNPLVSIDDDVESLQILLRLLQHQKHAVHRRIPPAQLLSLAVVSDKSACNYAIWFAMQWWQQQAMGDHKDPQCTAVLAGVALLTRQADNFRKLTKDMVLIHKGESGVLPAEHEVLGWDETMAPVRSQRKKACDDINALVAKIPHKWHDFAGMQHFETAALEASASVRTQSLYRVFLHLRIAAFAAGREDNIECECKMTPEDTAAEKALWRVDQSFRKRVMAIQDTCSGICMQYLLQGLPSVVTCTETH